MLKNKSISWINNLKAIGILLVIIGHNDTIFTKYIYSFHMPLFFFLSGMLFNEDKWTDGKQYIKQRFKSLLIPYLILSIILYIIWIPLDIIQGKPITGNILLKNFIGIFYSQGVHEYMTWGVPMWFLTCLFLVSIIFFVINKKYKKNIYLIFIISSFVGYLFNFSSIRLPWSLDVVPVALVFYGIGNLIKVKLLEESENGRVNGRVNLIILASLIISIVCGTLNNRIDMYSSTYNNYFLFYIGAFSGITYVVLLIKKIPESKILNLIGISTIPILAFHIRALEVIKFIVMRILNLDINFNSIAMGVFILPILQLVLLIPVIFVINKIIKYVQIKLS